MTMSQFKRILLVSTQRLLRLSCIFSLALSIPDSAASQINVCPNTQWDKQNPDIIGITNQLNDVWGISSTSVYAVGEEGLILHFNGWEWKKMTSPTNTDLLAVWGSSDNNVYAVGPYVVLRYNGMSWTALAGPNPGYLIDVHGGGGRVFCINSLEVYEADASHFWLVKRFYESPCELYTDLTSIWVSPQGNYCVSGVHEWCDEDCWICHDKAFIDGLHATQFSYIYPYKEYVFVWGTSENDIYVNLGGRIAHYGASGWDYPTPPETLSRISGASATDVFGITQNSHKLIFYDGDTWSTTDDAPIVAPTSLWGSSRNDIHLVGGRKIQHYDGQNYEVYGSSGISVSDLQGVWASAPNNAYAVGSAPGLFHYTGDFWMRVPEVTANLNGIWGSSETNIFAVGDSGYVYHYNGFAWSRDQIPAAPAPLLYAVSGRTSDEIYVIGEGGGIGWVLRYENSSWYGLKHLSNPRSLLVLPDYIYVGTYNGSVWRFDNNTWVEFPQVFSTMPILSIWGTTPEEIWLGGSQAYLVQMNGVTGQVIRELYSEDSYLDGAYSIWGTSPTSFYTSDSKGRIHYFDGTGLYADYGSWPYQKLNGIYGLDDCRVFAVGEKGTVLFLDAIADGTEISIDTRKNLDDRTLIVVPGEPVCGYFLVNPAHRFIDIDFEVFGANQVLGSAQTNYKGEVAFCYVPDRLGTDYIFGKLAGVVYTTDLLTIHLQAPQLAFGGPYSGVTIPGEEKCFDLSLDLAFPGIEIDFTITGANPESSVAVTDDTGKAAICYQTLNAGMDTIAATATFDFPAVTVVSSDRLVIECRPPSVSFDGQFSNGEEVPVLPGENFCVTAVLEKKYSDIDIAFFVSGANSAESIFTTDSDGKATFCYATTRVGADTITASAAFDFLSGPVLSSDQLVLLLTPGISIVVDSVFHSGCDTLIIRPNERVGAHFTTIPPTEGITLHFTVQGANNADSLATTGADGKAVCYYAPSATGADTVTVDAGLFYGASLPLYLTHPVLVHDPHFHEKTDSILVGLTTEISSRFRLQPGVDGIPVAIRISGANNIVDTALTNSEGFVDYSYAVGTAGPDTITATARIAYGEETILTSDYASLFTFLPTISVDESHHTGMDTVVTGPDDKVYGYFIIDPVLEGLPADYFIRGANPCNGTVTSDTSGLITIEYLAQNTGTDSITATTCTQIAATSPDHTAQLVLVIVEGTGLPIVLNMASGFTSGEIRSIEFTLDSNQELNPPQAEFHYISSSGGEHHTQGTMKLIPDGGWIYHTGYECTEDGRLHIDIRAANLYGYPVEMSADHDVCRIDRYTPLDWISNDGEISLQAKADAVITNGLVLAERDSITSTGQLYDDGDLEPLSDAFHFSTNANFISSPSLTFRYGQGVKPDTPSNRFDPRKVGIYKQSGGGWDYMGGQGDGESVTARIDLPGTYAAFYNESYEVVPTATKLFQNYPNPFYPNTTITFDLHEEGDVQLVIYNVEGKRIQTLLAGRRNAGVHEIPWNGFDSSGNPVATGVYLYRLKTQKTVQTKKMILLR